MKNNYAFIDIHNNFEIYKSINEYFYLEDGVFVSDLKYIFEINGKNISLFINKRALKHIIESRKKDNYSLNKICNMFYRLEEIINNNNYIIKNHLLIENQFLNKDGVIIVIDLEQIEDNAYYIKTAFLRSIAKIGIIPIPRGFLSH